jgi:hypothetical protein
MIVGNLIDRIYSDGVYAAIPVDETPLRVVIN